MKKSKRILSIIGIVLLISLYVTTLVLAFADPTEEHLYFKASLFLCVVIPVMLYAYILTYKYMRGKRPTDNNDK